MKAFLGTVIFVRGNKYLEVLRLLSMPIAWSAQLPSLYWKLKPQFWVDFPLNLIIEVRAEFLRECSSANMDW